MPFYPSLFGEFWENNIAKTINIKSASPKTIRMSNGKAAKNEDANIAAKRILNKLRQILNNPVFRLSMKLSFIKRSLTYLTRVVNFGDPVQKIPVWSISGIEVAILLLLTLLIIWVISKFWFDRWDESFSMVKCYEPAGPPDLISRKAARDILISSLTGQLAHLRCYFQCRSGAMPGTLFEHRHHQLFNSWIYRRSYARQRCWLATVELFDQLFRGRTVKLQRQHAG